MAKREFEYSDGKSFKFWHIERKGNQLVTQYGRIGAKGQETTKDFPDEAKAIAGEEKLIKQKTSKGYEEVAGGGGGGGDAAGGRREFHFVSGSSSKFWAIELKGSSFDVTYGKIGTDGRTTSKEFKSEDAAKKASDKLIEEKTSKGYDEVSVGGGGDDSGSAALPEKYFSTTKDSESIGEMTMFIGKRIAEYKGPKSLKKGNKHVYKFVVDYDDEAKVYEKRLDEYLASDAVESTDGLVFGNWAPESECSSEFIVKKLVAAKDRLPNLVAIFLGEIGQEESEMSWIQQCDVGPLFSAFPNLEMLRTRGTEGLAFSKLKHDKLRALGVEAGGLPKKIVSQICKAKLPNLEYLELWLGTSDYGGDCTVNDLQPILKGKAFPKLKYLGLRNSEIADDIAGVVVSSPIVKQLETLDLSLGTLTDEGANALLALPTDGKLKRLDVHHHYVSKPLVKKLKDLPFTVNTADRQETEDWGDGEMRFVAVGE